jgi:hypothetical protein
MSRGRSDSPDFMSQARTLAAGTREPYLAWSYLRRWATGKGPAAMKAAMVGFLELHGSKPESAAIIPEIMRSASMMPPPERKGVLEFASRSFSSLSGFQGQPPRERSHGSLPMSGSRPEFQSSLRMKREPSAPLEGAGERFLASRDVEAMRSMRNEMFRVNERLLPEAGHSDAAQQKRISSESFRPVLGAHKGNAIMGSLIERLRSHGRGEMPQEPKKPAVRKVKAKRKVKAAPGRRAKAIKASARRAPVRRKKKAGKRMR